MRDCGLIQPDGPLRVPGWSPSFIVRHGTSDENAIREVWTRNDYQRPRRGFLIEPEDRWLDLGANIGAFSVLAGKLATLTAAFEPEPENAALLAANLERNGLDPGLVERAAVVPDDHPVEHVTLNVQHGPKALYRHSIMFARRDSHEIEVPARRINGVVNSANAIKMDIEGAEIPILTTWQPPEAVRKLVAEWSFDVDNRLVMLGAALRILQERFAHVELDKRIDWTKATFEHYPPTVMIYAWGGPP